MLLVHTHKTSTFLFSENLADIVYPDLFPNRRRMLSKNNKRVDSNTNNAKTNGASLIPVRSYDEFLQYLMDKDDRIQMATLPFEGKNKVIYKIIDEVI